MAKRIYLVILMTLGIGIFANAQQKSKKTKPVTIETANEMPVLVSSTKKAKKRAIPNRLVKKHFISISTKPKSVNPTKPLKKE